MLLAVMLNVTGKTALVVGGGNVALRRAQTLLAAGMHLKVVAPDIHPDLQAAATEVCLRPFATSDLANNSASQPASTLNDVALVLACTNDAAINTEVARLAQERGLWVNQAGDAEQGNLRFGAQWEHSGVTFAVGTPVALPMLPQAIRQRLQALWPAPWPVSQWAQQRRAALHLPEHQRQAALKALKSDIQQAVGL